MMRCLAGQTFLSVADRPSRLGGLRSARARRLVTGQNAWPTGDGFTLVEVLATLVLMAIVIPAALRGVSLSLASANRARHLTEAAALADTRINQLIHSGSPTLAGTAGDFGDAWPTYRWACQVQGRDYGLSELQVTVSWTERGVEQSLSVSTLIREGEMGVGQ